MRAGNVAKPGMKAMNGGGGSVSRSTQKHVAAPEEKPKPKPKATSHSQLAMQWEANGRDANGKVIKHVERKKEWTKDEINRARDRAAEERRQAAQAVAVNLVAAADVGEELEVVPDGEPAHVLARERMANLAQKLQCLAMCGEGEDKGGDAVGGGDGGGSSSSGGKDELWAAAECRRSQLEEVECLQAIFINEFASVTPSDTLATMREALDSLGDDVASADEAALREVAAQPPLEFALQLTCEGERSPPAAAADGGDGGGGDSSDEASAQSSVPSTPLVASILLRVRLPLSYPHAPPTFLIEDAMVTTRAPLGKHKVLATRALLDEAGLVAAMCERAAATLPDPSIYEVASWLTESGAFEFVGQAWI